MRVCSPTRSSMMQRTSIRSPRLRGRWTTCQRREAIVPQNPSLKDPELYDKLVDEGNSKQKAARISNAAARDGRSSVGAKGGAAQSYEDQTVPELRERAKEIGLTGYSRLRKSELVAALRDS